MNLLSTFALSHPTTVRALVRGLRSGALHHALLLTGRGAEALAESVAMSLVCQKRGDTADACQACRPCLLFLHGNHPDVRRLSGDLTVDGARALADSLTFAPREAKYHVILLDHAGGLSVATQNALLKSIEEPPVPTQFLLVGSALGSLLATLRSRTTRIQLGTSVQQGLLVDDLGPADSLAALARPWHEQDPTLANDFDAASLERALHLLKQVVAGELTAADVVEVSPSLVQDAAAFAWTLRIAETLIHHLWTEETAQKAPNRARVAAFSRSIAYLWKVRSLLKHNLGRTFVMESLLLCLMPTSHAA